MSRVTIVSFLLALGCVSGFGQRECIEQGGRIVQEVDPSFEMCVERTP
jgi:hypothetical protein